MRPKQGLGFLISGSSEQEDKKEEEDQGVKEDTIGKKSHKNVTPRPGQMELREVQIK